MNLSNRLLPLVGLPLITVLAVSCAQSGSGAPAAPSALSRGSSATAVGPSAGYDATGLWHFVQTSSNPDLNETFDANVTQDPTTGNLSVQRVGHNNVVTLERLSQGDGAIITYRITQVTDEGACDFRNQGTARLDTKTNTITAMLRFKELGCTNEREGAVVTGTKVS